MRKGAFQTFALFAIFFIQFTVVNAGQRSLNCINNTVGIQCNLGSPRCLNGTPLPLEPTPVNLTIAFFGDQGLTTSSTSVLQLIKSENASLVVHSGDYDYTSSPLTWENQINSVLGPNFPYIASIGNHDAPTWSGTPSYPEVLLRRLNGANITTCIGDIGTNSYCTFKGIGFVLSGINQIGVNHADYIDWAFSTYPTVWRVAAWHKNQHLLQLGAKTDEAGYHIYDQSRRFGALIATGHEHSYARTKLMTSFSSLTFDSSVDPANMTISRGRTVAWVSGVGGYDVRDFQFGLQNNPWWASAQALSSGLTAGALFCKFNLNGKGNQAFCYFKQINGLIRDQFYLTSTLTSQVVDEPIYRVQVSSNNDNAVQITSPTPQSTSTCALGYLALGQDGANSQIVGLRFNSVNIPKNYSVLEAYLELSCNVASGIATNFTISGELSGNSLPLCGTDLRARTKTSASISWVESDPGSWPQPGVQYVTPNIASLIQEIILSPSWTQNSPISLFISGSGTRNAYSYSGNSCQAPILIITASPTPPQTTGVPVLTTAQQGTTAQLQTTGVVQQTTGVVQQTTNQPTPTGEVTTASVTGEPINSFANSLLPLLFNFVFFVFVFVF